MEENILPVMFIKLKLCQIKKTVKNNIGNQIYFSSNHNGLMAPFLEAPKCNIDLA